MMKNTSTQQGFTYQCIESFDDTEGNEHFEGKRISEKEYDLLDEQEQTNYSMLADEYCMNVLISAFKLSINRNV